ncbi:hypothetical protein R5R35_012819 [Gryllus longicercus]|uniref:Ig-like domain-containing protein n=1 Tax=Gryllus longicercus TaxID=2509291 RepID=A0AAN9YYB0_9ORTH
MHKSFSILQTRKAVENKNRSRARFHHLSGGSTCPAPGPEHPSEADAPSLLQSPTPPQYVFWYHNDRMINYDNARGGITVDTEPGPKTQSRLTIRDAHDTDSGNYTCSASNTEPASIFVFVSEGDKMAAILRRKTSSGSGLDVVLWFVLLPLLVLAAR